jgi:type I restriction enzyme, S subunit
VKGETLPNGWKLEALGNLSSAIQYGYTAKAQAEPVGPKLLRITDIQNDTVRWEEVPFCKIKKEEKQKYLLAPNDILFARTGATVGKSYLIRDQVPDSVFASYLIRVRLTREVTPKYVAYFFKSTDYWRQITESQAGIGQPNVNGTKLAQIEIPVAPPDQQQRIVAEIEKQFSRLDEAVANLKRYKAAVLKAAVEGKLTEDWRKQHPNVEPASKLLEHILVERQEKWSGRGKYKEPDKPDTSNLSPLPEKWTWASVDQLTSHITSGSRDWTRYYGRGSGTFILAQNVRLMRLDLSDRQAVDPPKSDAETVRTRVSIGDLLVTIVGAKTGEVCRIPMELVEHFVCQSVARLRPVMPASAKFMELYLASPENGQAQWKHYIYGQGRPHLSFEQLKMTAIAVPPLAEQQKIVPEVERRLSVIEELESAVEANLTRADRLRQLILRHAFSGNLIATEGCLRSMVEGLRA